MNPVLARKINLMARRDLSFQKLLWDKVDGADEAAYLKITDENTKELKNIVKEHGWPTVSLVGKKASYNAWLIAQHSNNDRAFQRKARGMLIKINKSDPGEINKAHIAYLMDRLLIAQGKPQKFGTQFKFNKKGELKVRQVKNRRGVDALRNKYNLPPLKDFIDSAKEFEEGLKKKGIKHQKNSHSPHRADNT